MSDPSLPPPLSPTVPTPPPPVPPPRPELPVLAGCLIGCFGLLIVCCSGSAVLGIVSLREELTSEATARPARAERARERGRDTEARALLDALSARLTAEGESAGELPEMLTEAAPRDPWGTPIEYDRSAPDRASLRSAGPDARFGTRDDVRREILLKR